MKAVLYRACPRADARAHLSLSLSHSIARLSNLYPLPLSAPRRPFSASSPSRRALRSASRRFDFVKPPPRSSGLLEVDEDGEGGADTDFADLVDRSASGRRVFFNTLLHLLTLPPSSIDPSYVDAIVEGLETTHSPLLPREMAKCAEVWIHVGREDDAVKWVRKLLATQGSGSPVDERTLEGLRSRAQQSGAKGLERRLVELEQLARQRQLQPQPQSLPQAPSTSTPASAPTPAPPLPASRRSAAGARSR